MIEKDKIITLGNGKKYAIIDEVLYNDIKYYVASVYTDRVTDTLCLLKEKVEEGKSYIKLITDENEVTEVVYYYKKKEGEK